MDEDFKDVTEHGSVKIAIFVILFLVAVGAFGYFFVFQKYFFSAKTVKVEVNTELSSNVNDYLSKKVVDESSYKLNLEKVKIEEVGEYAYTITYNKTKKTGIIKIVDTTPPTFETIELTKEQSDDNFFLGDFLSTCEDYSKPCLVNLKNSKDESKLEEVGTHTLKIYVSDIYNNKSEATVTLNVVADGSYVDPKVADLEYDSNSAKVTDFNGEYYKKYDKALIPDSKEAEDEGALLSVPDWKDYLSANYESETLKNAEIIEIYNKSKYIIGFAIRITTDSGKIIYVTD